MWKIKSFLYEIITWKRSNLNIRINHQSRKIQSKIQKIKGNIFAMISNRTFSNTYWCLKWQQQWHSWISFSLVLKMSQLNPNFSRMNRRIEIKTPIARRTNKIATKLISIGTIPCAWQVGRGILRLVLILSNTPAFKTSTINWSKIGWSIELWG